MKQRGGQRKHWAERARLWTWYREIKRSSGWTDYQLDVEFACTEEGKKVRDAAKLRGEKSEHRPRTFEWIRKEARQPKGDGKRLRGMEDLVAAVNAHELFKGTAALYNSDLWKLIQSPIMPPGGVREKLDDLLDAHGLMRVDPGMHPHINLIIMKHNELPVFDRALRLSLRRMDGLSGIVLAWLMYLLAEPAENWKFRKSLESTADQLLDVFFEHYFAGDLHFTFYSDAIHTMQLARLDMMSNQAPRGYGYIETQGAWPILPKDLVATMTAEKLFALELFPFH
jgi:hypothetical protein